MSNFYPPGLQSERKTLAIDFDGVIHNAHMGWGDGTCYGEPLPNAIESLKKLSEEYDIVIFTAKAKADRPLVNGKTGAMLVREWFIKYNALDYIKGITSDKPRAELYIDDNGYRFQNWSDTLNYIKYEL